ncbi:alkaline ceramidase 3-like, partial [Acipenser ruthenus]
MAPAADRPGYWGRPTSTLDWCEENYSVSFYIAEFWNTVSNLILILPPIYGAIQTLRDGLETRYVFAYVGLAAVGIGSWCFHMTLQYEMQLLDELPMIYSC